MIVVVLVRSWLFGYLRRSDAVFPLPGVFIPSLESDRIHNISLSRWQPYTEAGSGSGAHCVTRRLPRLRSGRVSVTLFGHIGPLSAVSPVSVPRLPCLLLSRRSLPVRSRGNELTRSGQRALSQHWYCHCLLIWEEMWCRIKIELTI